MKNPVVKTPTALCKKGDFSLLMLHSDCFLNISSVFPRPPVADENPCAPNPCGENADCLVTEYDRTKHTCRCIAKHFGNPYLKCSPECIVNSDCPTYLHCVNMECKDPCPNYCGYLALCNVVYHQPECACPRGLEGDPKVMCRKRE